jgi:acyl-CoA synthetase (AMP-forming)/AMP-acid ligase II
MFIGFLSKVFKENSTCDAIIWQNEVYSYQWLLDRINWWLQKIRSESIPPGMVTVLEADFSPNSIALFIALMERCCILVPLTSAAETKKEEFIEIAQGEINISFSEDDQVKINQLSASASHEHYLELRRRNHPGLVLFSSGSTGESKAAVHDLIKILDKYKDKKQALRTITFLLFDHIGGVNTMLYTLANAGCIITVKDRTPTVILKTIERHRAELLPTSPTFINLLLLSKVYEQYDLTTLKTISYGTEPMPEVTLKRCHHVLPRVKLKQTYGLSEVGIMNTKSKSSDSLWLKVGGNGFKTKIVDGILFIKAKSAMLGYLNATSPFTEDGWFNTGDSVEIDGDYIKVLGRKSEIINVGGEKVYPTEVENVIQEMHGVEETTVSGIPSPITGQMVQALIRTSTNENLRDLRIRLRRFCKDRLEQYKIPQKILLSNGTLHNERFKKNRVV